METKRALDYINGTVRELKGYHLTPKVVPHKLNQNESPFDSSPAIKKEIAEFCHNVAVNRYPHFIPESLKNVVGAYAGVEGSQVIIGNGSNEMLLLSMVCLTRDTSHVIISEPTFAVYSLLAQGMGRQIVRVPLDDSLQYDIPGLAAASKSKPGALLIICSPNNPTGSTLSEEDIRKLVGAHDGFVLLDQAYTEFGGFNAVPLLKEYPNLLIARTFSKALGAAGLRLGYLLGSHEIISEMNKLKLPYNINSFSEGVAHILLSHRDCIEENVATMVRERDKLYDALCELPCENIYPSAANFILLRTPHKDALFSALEQKGILVRDVSSYPKLENCLRFSVGTPDENKLLISECRDFFTSLAEA